MARVRLWARFIGILLPGAAVTTTPAAAQVSPGDVPPEVRTVVSQTVAAAAFPEAERLCWALYESQLADGAAPGPFRRTAFELGYVAAGSVSLELADGETRDVPAESGYFLPGETPRRLRAAGGAARVLWFLPSCGRLGPDPLVGAGTRLVGVVGPLRGFRPDQPAYTLTLRRGTSGPGGQGPVVRHPGPVVYYLLEGETAIVTADRSHQYRRGDLFALPPRTPYQYTNVGEGANRSLYLIVTPEGAPVSEVLPDARFPQPFSGGAGPLGRLLEGFLGTDRR